MTADVPAAVEHERKQDEHERQQQENNADGPAQPTSLAQASEWSSLQPPVAIAGADPIADGVLVGGKPLGCLPARSPLHPRERRTSFWGSRFGRRSPGEGAPTQPLHPQHRSDRVDDAPDAAAGLPPPPPQPQTPPPAREPPRGSGDARSAGSSPPPPPPAPKPLPPPPPPQPRPVPREGPPPHLHVDTTTTTPAGQHCFPSPAVPDTPATQARSAVEASTAAHHRHEEASPSMLAAARRPLSAPAPRDRGRNRMKKRKDRGKADRDNGPAGEGDGRPATAETNQQNKRGFLANLGMRIKLSSMAMLTPTKSPPGAPTKHYRGSSPSTQRVSPAAQNSPEVANASRRRTVGTRNIRGHPFSPAFASLSANHIASRCGRDVSLRSAAVSSPNLRLVIPAASDSPVSTKSAQPAIASFTVGSPTPSPIAVEVTETTEVIRDMDPTTGNKMINQYMIIRELGRGCHGKVKLAVDVITGEHWAIKIVDKSTRRRFGVKATTPTNLDKVRREIAILKKCLHQHVVRLREVIDAPDARKMYLVLEFVDGGEIKWKMPDDDQPILSIDTTRRVFRDVVLGLEYLHYQGIIHRDIKPANLLWTKDHVVKISDFGVSYVSKRTTPRAGPNDPSASPTLTTTGGSKSSDNFGLACESTSLSISYVTTSSLAEDIDAVELAKTAGSPAFFAPELCTVGDDVNYPSGVGPDPSRLSSAGQPVTKAIDVWALGVTLYCFVYGRCPFMAESEYELFNLIPKAPIFFPNDRFVDVRASPGYGALEAAAEDGCDECRRGGEDGPGRAGHAACESNEFLPDALKVYEEEEEEEGENNRRPVRNLVSVKDRCNAGLGIVDDSLRDLISRLLEKDASKRITLDDVKRHPWVTADLLNPEEWYNSTNPSAIYNPLEVSEKEVKEAVTTLMGRIRDRIRKISYSLSTLASGGGRRRTRSVPTSAVVDP